MLLLITAAALALSAGYTGRQVVQARQEPKGNARPGKLRQRVQRLKGVGRLHRSAR